MSLIPPLKFYFNSPVSPDNSSPVTAAPNDSWFNSTNSLYSIPVSIANNSVTASFNKNSFIQTYNLSTELYLDNNNDNLTNSIGNFLATNLNIKTNIQGIFNNRNALRLYVVYDKNIYYGTIISSYSNNNNFRLNANGSLNDIVTEYNIIYSDGYYAYLTNNVTNQYNITTLEIINGIRTVTIPPDPTGKYALVDVIAKYSLVDICYYNNITSTFVSNNNNIISDYFLNAVLTQDVTIQLPIGTYTSNFITKSNVVNPSNFDGLEFELYSIPNKNALLKSGNIFGLLISYNKIPTILGTVASYSSSKRFGVILYADGDFTYLNNKGVLLFPYAKSIDLSTGTRIISIPAVPSDYVTAQTRVSPNITVGTVTTYYTFYNEKINNANVYNQDYNTQNYTLGTSNIYDSYDFINNVPGNIIGTIVAYKVTSTAQNGLQTTGTITSYNFANGSILLTASIDNYALTNIGDLVANVRQNQNIISHSINYDQAFNGVYNVTVNSGLKIDTVFVNSLVN